MIYFLLWGLLIGSCCNLVINAANYLMKRPKPSDDFHPASYNMGLRDAGEIVRDVRIEAGLDRGEHPLLEEIFGRLRKCYR